MNKTAAFITRTAIMLALVTLFQYLGDMLGRAVPALPPNFFSAGLINAVLCVSVLLAGVESGLIVGCLTPVMGFITGHMAQPQLMPFVAIGNVLFVLGLYYAEKLSRGKVPAFAVRAVIGIIIGSALKWAYMSFIVAGIMLELIGIPEKGVAVLKIRYGIVQLFSALAGGAVGAGVFVPVSKAVKPLGEEKSADGNESGDL